MLLFMVCLLPICSAWYPSESTAPNGMTMADCEKHIKRGYFFTSIVDHLTKGMQVPCVQYYFEENFDINWLDTYSAEFVAFKILLDRGLTTKVLTFNVYNDDMREEAVALYKLLRTLPVDEFHMTVGWASVYANDNILEYSIRLAIIYPYNLGIHDLQMPPPFVVKPYYYFNSQTIRKIKDLKMMDGLFETTDATVNKNYENGFTVGVNSNYSGWNLLGNGCSEKLSYFREDIGLNSFYYGVHLSYPFWMSSEELSKSKYGRGTEHYFYIHQQLLARYSLELEANGLSKEEGITLRPKCDFPTYKPDLEYPNGLSFPVRFPYSPNRDPEAAKYLSSVNTIMEELADRGMGLVQTYGSTLNMTEDNFMETIRKLIRVNVDGPNYAKIARSMYGSQGYPVDKYNPAPSVLHHPETSLRDPIYWGLISHVMGFFEKFKASIPMNNLSEYETTDFDISLRQSPKIATYFEYYQTKIINYPCNGFDESLTNKMCDISNLTFTARQKRLSHLPFKIEFDIKSKKVTLAIVRLYLGPKSESKEDSFIDYDRWYELDTIKVSLEEGNNTITWSPATATRRYSSDQDYNMELELEEKNSNNDCEEGYSMMKFPERLAIPKGRAEGFEATLFVMISGTEESEIATNYDKDKSTCNRMLKLDMDKMPLGFPFNRPSFNYNPNATNYKFFDVTIHHNTNDPKQDSGYFSPELY